MPTQREIVRSAIDHRSTHSVPFHIDVLAPVRARLEEHYGTDDIDQPMGNYLRWFNASESWESLGDNLERDEFGVVWATNEFNRGHIVEYTLKNPTLEGYTFPEFDNRSRFAHIADAAKRDNDKYLVAWTGDLFERACFLRGLDHILMDMKLHPEFVHELLDRILSIVLANAEAICEYPVDALFLSDDYGIQASLMMSPNDWRVFVKPHLAKVVEFVHKNKRKVFLHSCGNVTAILTDLIDVGVDVLHPIQPEAMDIFEIKREFGDRITLYGGISTQETLRSGTPEDVRLETKRVVSVLGEGGGYILGPGITLQHDIPWDNLLAFIDACQASTTSV